MPIDDALEDINSETTISNYNKITTTNKLEHIYAIRSLIYGVFTIRESNAIDVSSIQDILVDFIEFENDYITIFSNLNNIEEELDQYVTSLQPANLQGSNEPVANIVHKYMVKGTRTKISKINESAEKFSYNFDMDNIVKELTQCSEFKLDHMTNRINDELKSLFTNKNILENIMIATHCKLAIKELKNEIFNTNDTAELTRNIYGLEEIYEASKKNEELVRFRFSETKGFYDIGGR
jgi:hypothetical protein